MAEGDGTNGSAAAKAAAATETKDAPPAAEAKDAPAPAVDEADVLEEDDDFEEFEEDRTSSWRARVWDWTAGGAAAVRRRRGSAGVLGRARGAVVRSGYFTSLLRVACRSGEYLRWRPLWHLWEWPPIQRVWACVYAVCAGTGRCVPVC